MRRRETQQETINPTHELAGLSELAALSKGGLISQNESDILLKQAVVVPMNERWLHEPAMKKKLARADEWMRNNPAKETKLEELEASLKAHS